MKLTKKHDLESELPLKAKGFEFWDFHLKIMGPLILKERVLQYGVAV